MINRYVSCYFMLILSAWAATAGPVRAGTTTIAHWSFNKGTITQDAGGNVLTAADSTGAHDATTQTLGTGAISSIAGPFGRAASFNNANANGQAQTTNNVWMSFPQLTEIAGASGGDFSVAAWVNAPASASWDDNPIVADWGNAPANTNRFTYWFQLDNVDSNANLRPRAQIRAANSPPSATNIDIIATTLSSAQAGTNGGPTVFDDDTWHHLTWTWTKSTGEMKFYTDGVLRHTQTTGQPPGPNRDLLISDSPVGALGAKRDNNRYFRGAMDEVKVFNGALTDEQVLSLKNTNVIPEPNTLLVLMSGAVLAAMLPGLRSRRV
jgi:hypothetical protein